MIIKSTTRKTQTWKQLLEYMMRDKSRNESFILKQNIEGNTIKEWSRYFMENEKNRVHKRANNVKLYHEILSWSNKDSNKMTVAKMKDMAQKYMELRSENALAIAVPHYDKGHFHIHFCFSGVEIETGKAIRISQHQFKDIKNQIEEYQRKLYPELQNSIVDHQAKGKSSKKEREYQLIKRTNELSERERIKQTIETSYAKSLSQADFMHRLSEQGLKTYHNNAKLQGVEFGRKYHFGSFGYDEKKLGELNYRDEALKGIQVFRDQNEKGRDRNQEIDDDMPIRREVEYENNTDYKGGKEVVNKDDDVLNNDMEVDADFDLGID
jgi:hypothetical protein